MEGTMLVLKADGGAEMRSLGSKPSLEELQEAVGGYIEQVPAFDLYGDRKCIAFCNEEGKSNGLPFNLKATQAWAKINGGTLHLRDVLLGDVVIIQGDEAFMSSLRGE